MKESKDFGLAPKRLAALYRISRTLVSSIKLDKLLSHMIEIVAENLCADTVSIMFFDKESGGLTIKASKGLDSKIVRDTHIRLGERIAGVVAREKKPYLLIDGRFPPEFKGIIPRKEVGSCICAPIILLDEVIGVISVARMTGKKDFVNDDLKVLWLFAEEAARSITNAQFYEEMEKRVKEKTIELEEANERLKELDRLKSDFVSMVSHELKTPLTSLRSYLEILRDHKVDEKTRFEFLGIINKEVLRLTRLVDNLLDISMIEAGKFRVKTRRMSIKKVIDDSISAIEAIADEKGIKVSSEIEDDLPSILIDSERLFQVMENLLGNAMKFTSAGGLVRVKACKEDGFIKVSVSDTGIGIREDDFERIFERFYQGGSKRNRPRGAGLGLPISKEIISQHKGRIWVESEVGKGSTFYFTLPC